MSNELNKKTHLVNGKKRTKGKPITTSFWNKEFSLLANKQGDIIEVIQKYKPLVLGIG